MRILERTQVSEAIAMERIWVTVATRTHFALPQAFRNPLPRVVLGRWGNH